MRSLYCQNCIWTLQVRAPYSQRQCSPEIIRRTNQRRKSMYLTAASDSLRGPITRRCSPLVIRRAVSADGSREPPVLESPTSPSGHARLTCRCRRPRGDSVGINGAYYTKTTCKTVGGSAGAIVTCAKIFALFVRRAEPRAESNRSTNSA